jgi:flagellar protein FlaG
MSGMAQVAFRTPMADQNRLDDLSQLASRNFRSGIGVPSGSPVLSGAVSSVMQSSFSLQKSDEDAGQTGSPADLDVRQGEEQKDQDPIVLAGELTDEVNALLSNVTSLRFSVEKELDQVVIQVVDNDTDEMVRQIPPEHMIALVKRMRELTGLLFDSTA